MKKWITIVLVAIACIGVVLFLYFTGSTQYNKCSICAKEKWCTHYELIVPPYEPEEYWFCENCGRFIGGGANSIEGASMNKINFFSKKSNTTSTPDAE